MNHADFMQIAFQASSLWEQFNHHWGQPPLEHQTQQTDAILQRWCETAAQGNWEKFEKRLAWDGLDSATVKAVLAASTVNPKDEPVSLLPDSSWIETLQAIVRMALEQSLNDRKTVALPIEPEKPLSFEDILLPVLLAARQKLWAQINPTAMQVLSEGAYLQIERQFLHQLIALCTPTLDVEFSRFRPLGQTLLNRFITPQEQLSTTYYRAFVEKQLSDGLLTLFQTYPVLGRLIATTVDFWVSATADFLQHLNTDWADLQHTFAESLPLGQVTQVESSLSDAHHQMRTVIALTFDSGLKLIYKPRDLGLEVAYQYLLAWCNEQSELLPFKVLRVLDRTTHGWVEYVEQLPCQDELAAQRFYQRSGMLLCLLYVLRTTDCHYGNLIASGEHLVLVDMEALMHPTADPLVESWNSTNAQNGSDQQFWDSVLRTGLLPQWELNKQNRVAFDISGLGSVDPQQAPRKMPCWKAINTDDMRLVYESVTLPLEANVPVLNGTPLSPNNYLPQLLEGFEEMYRFLLQQRASLLDSNSPLSNLKHQRVRFVFRATQIYDAIKQKSLSPQFLRNGIDRSIELDVLSRAFLVSPTKPKAWAILQAERKSLEQLDIPHFEVRAEDVALMSGSQTVVEQYFQHSSFSEVEAQLQQLSEGDLARQVTLIRGAFCARIARVPNRDRTSPIQTINNIASPTAELFLREAEAIAAEIENAALLEPDGSASWIALTYLPEVERFQFRPLGDTLYDGRSGIALFLAAMSMITGRSQYRSLALSALGSLRSWMHHSDIELSQKVANSLGIGGATGLGSLIYALVRINQFLQEPTLLEDAERIARYITPELIATDHQLDILGGAAGAILGLLTLYEISSDPKVLAAAEYCGHHLLTHQVSINGLPKSWKTISETPLTGFSHGAAGIAYALLKLYRVTRNRCYFEAAQEGIAYERHHFSTEVRNWADLRHKQPSFMTSWCHGAPGIGLARMGSLLMLETDSERNEAQQEIRIALETTMNYPQAIDHLCCGNFGRVEALLLAEQLDARSGWKEKAKQQAAWTISKSEQAGGYQLFLDLPTMFNPGFFQGTAGIGYQLLRLANPEALPSVLLWQ
ncbi:type 2 lantipeptide synthetase LanM [Leptolyngbya sp. FACHB-17]|uniref:type 2 lanthipeptide synthetase LanM n=2 Tax=unclassified Leptolyngbya TaxID=2650499 RepID=UPI0016807499|nr:type 2 lantipeptide synthetase LanM [Leptolyngbya sp. FACHB-17]